MRLKDVVPSPCRSLLRGLGKAATLALGVFAGDVQKDDMETVQNFIVVADEKMEGDGVHWIRFSIEVSIYTGCKWVYVLCRYQLVLRQLTLTR